MTKKYEWNRSVSEGTPITECSENCSHKCIHTCNSDGWSSMDDPEGTGDHENYKYLIFLNILFPIHFLSDDEIECLQIRIRNLGTMNTADDNKRMKLYHSNADGIFGWNPKVNYGFHCFNERQENNKCEKLEYRTFINCN